MEADAKTAEHGTNPISAIALAIGLALAMVAVTFTIFINSGAYTTVKQIQVGTNFARSNKMDGYDSTSPIKATDIAKYQQDLNNRLNTYDDKNDFGPADISDSALGLQ